MAALDHLPRFLLGLHLAIAAVPAGAQESAEWSKSPGSSSATIGQGKEHELIGTAAGFDGANLVVVTHWKPRTDTPLAKSGLPVSEGVIRCLDVYDQEQTIVKSTCFAPLK